MEDEMLIFFDPANSCLRIIYRFFINFLPN